ncbi:MAG: hypothetical protein EZS28_004104 [Streblomastix strix]|uniref:Uncharacterized protein n=1 Tax=Streblomastix strix TaxID=222440 RepID=A0A5J4WZQ0_9EUKA|nr:MAG: hypothetical protein EZS28_004104 [Streblomastix strix]
MIRIFILPFSEAYDDEDDEEVDEDEYDVAKVGNGLYSIEDEGEAILLLISFEFDLIESSVHYYYIGMSIGDQGDQDYCNNYKGGSIIGLNVDVVVEDDEEEEEEDVYDTE